MNDLFANNNPDLYRYVPIKRQEDGSPQESAPTKRDNRLLTCPRCGRKFHRSQTQAMPFCSAQCRKSDLNRWLSEEYTVETLNPQFGDEEE